MADYAALISPTGYARQTSGPPRTRRILHMIPSDQPHNDRPINEPTQDRFGIDPFAQTLAASILRMQAPEGTVIALNGPWGSGKSSAVNLVLYHLQKTDTASEMSIVNFACWWFRGEEALALAFFRELYAGIGPSLGDRFKKALPSIGARLLKAGSIVSSGADLVGASGTGHLAASAMSWAADLIKSDTSVEKLYKELTEALSEQNKRFLVVIDDIDRLAPDEALLVFRLIKSVGRLPNIIYLLVFDRELAEAAVADRYPSEGPHYLEKIIQAGFDIPLPRQTDLNEELLRQIELVCGSPREEKLLRFMNVFYEVIAPEIKTPRDLVRLTNALSVTWAAVGTEVDRADFIGLETLRLFRPAIYRSIRDNKEKLCGIGNRFGQPERDRSEEMDTLFLQTVADGDKDRVKRSLMRLFPRLEGIWKNHSYADDFIEHWSRDRLACTEKHFDSYFRFSIGDDVLSQWELNEIIDRASDEAFIGAKLLEALGTRRRDGSTKAKLILDELILHSAGVSRQNVPHLLNAVFRIADELDVEADRDGGFSLGDNQLRIHWLLRSLTNDRFDLEDRSEVFSSACIGASLGWLVDFACSAYVDHYPQKGSLPEPEHKCLTTKKDAEILHKLALDRIRTASGAGELANSKRLAYLMFRWRDLAGDNGAEVKAWANDQMDRDEMIATFARAFTSHGWSQSIDDVVAKRSLLANVGSLNKVLDRDKLRKRIEEIAAKGGTDDDAIAISVFLGAWDKHKPDEEE